MSDVAQDVALVAQRCNILEKVLTNQYGATGNGLGEKTISVADRLSPQLNSNLKYIARERNKVIHEYQPLRDRNRFIRCCDEAERELQVGAGASGNYTASVSTPSSSRLPSISFELNFLPHYSRRYENDDPCTHCGHQNYDVCGTWGMLYSIWDRIGIIAALGIALIWTIIAAAGPVKNQSYLAWVGNSFGGLLVISIGIVGQSFLPYLLMHFFRPKLLLRCASCSKTSTSTTTLPTLTSAIRQAIGYFLLVAGLPLLIILIYPIFKGATWFWAIAIFIFGKRIYNWILSWYV
jgi:hypothetical protein